MKALLLLVCIFCAAALEGAPSEVLWAPGDAPGTVLLSFRQGLESSQLRAEARRLGLDPGADGAALRVALVKAAGASVDLDLPLLGVQRVRIGGQDKASVDAALRSFRFSPLVLAAEPDHPIHAAVNLNDPLYTGGQQWGLTATSWPAAVAAYNAGSIVLQGSVSVAVIDSGVDLHSDLSGQVLAGTSFVSAEPTTDDLNGHGTFCAGLIAAVSGNALGMAGAFFEPSKVRILPVKVLDSAGNGQISNLVAGMAYAQAQGVRIFNISIESTQSSQALETAVNEARKAGVFIAAAAGNDYGGATAYPAAYAGAFAVGALDHLGNVAAYSNVGKIELSAPGGDLVASCPCQGAPVSGCPFEIWSLEAVKAACPGSPRYEGAAGTSFAAPLVAAAAALLLSQDPGRRVEDLQRILLQTALPTAQGAGYHGDSGWGKLNFYGALSYQSGATGMGAALKVYNWPNPFSPDKEGLTTLSFFLPGGGPVTLRLLDAGGDLVKRWSLDGQTGMNLLAWDGKNGSGDPVANGAYTLLLNSGGAQARCVVAVLR